MAVRCKRIVCLLMLAVALLGLFGCGKQTENGIVLWVVTEETALDGMNGQAKQVIEVFEEEHPGVSVTLDILPRESSEREVALKQLRTKIMAGKGPDVFLLPSCNARTYAAKSWTISEKRTLANAVEPLFLDPSQSMRNGIFLDISSYYDQDEALEKETLQQTIMEVGTVDGRRYVLPLRYDFPALYVDVEGVQALGLDLAALEGSAMDLMDTTLALGEPLFASGAEPGFCRTGSAFSLLPPALDYDAGTVTLDVATLTSFLEKYQALVTLTAGNHDTRQDPSVARYISAEKVVGTYVPGQDFEVEQADGFPRSVPITVGTLSAAPCAAAIAKVEKREFRMIPLRASDGTLVANVTYYGAIGAGCNSPKLAYDFLRRFLMEENQWEQNRPQQRDNINRDMELQYHPIEDGWPVRARDGVESLWNVLRRGVDGLGSQFEKGLSRSQQIMDVHLSDADIPLLDAKIDRVSFGHTLEQNLAETLRSLNDPKTGEALDADLDELAARLIRELTWQMMEG